VYCGNLKIKDTMYYEIVIQQKKKRESHYISLGRDEKVGSAAQLKDQTPYLLWKDMVCNFRNCHKFVDFISILWFLCVMVRGMI